MVAVHVDLSAACFFEREILDVTGISIVNKNLQTENCHQLAEQVNLASGVGLRQHGLKLRACSIIGDPIVSSLSGINAWEQIEATIRGDPLLLDPPQAVAALS